MPGTALWVRVHLSPFVSLHLSPVLSQGSFVSLLSPFICLLLSPSLDAWHGSPGGRVHLSPFALGDAWHGSLGGFMSPFVSLHLSPFVSQPGCLARLDGRILLSPFISLHLSWTLCLPSFVSHCLPAWMPGTALWADRVSFPLSPFICLVVSQPGCLARLSEWTDSLVFPSPFIWPRLAASRGGRVYLLPTVSPLGRV